MVVAPESRMTDGEGGTTTVGRGNVGSILSITVVPAFQAGAIQKQLVVLPPCMFVAVALT